jgi:hypothetical protein
VVLPPIKTGPPKPQQPQAAERSVAPRAEQSQRTQSEVLQASAEPVAPKEGSDERPRPAPRPVRPRKPIEPKIFVPPHAPDDPGPEPAEDNGRGHDPFGPSPAKA